MVLIVPGPGGNSAFPTVTAEVFEDKQFGGRNKAVLLGCKDGAGASVTCVVKLKHRVESQETFWVEWVAGLLADELGVHVPPRYVVEISPVFTKVIGKKLGADASGCAGPNLGIGYVLNSMIVRNAEHALESQFREDAAKIACFDAFIDNIDRRKDNPNCLLEAGPTPRLVAIDHDLAFSGLYLTIILPPPWPQDLLAKHLFTRRFGTNKPDVQGILDAITGLSDAFLDELPNRVPPLWLGTSGAASLGRVIAKLKERRDNIESWLVHFQAWVEA